MWVERDIVGLRKTDRLTHFSSVTYLRQCGDELLSLSLPRGYPAKVRTQRSTDLLTLTQYLR